MQAIATGSPSHRSLSVVVGAVECSRSISACMRSLEIACEGLSAEIIVVSAGDDPAISAAVAKLPAARLVTLPRGSLIPRLWSEGLSDSTGEIIAFITAHCEVSPTWAGAMAASMGTRSAVGGPLRLAANASLLDAAIFLLRYSAYLAHRSDSVTDIAGDNAAYARDAIPPDTWSRERGFWELNVNRAIVNNGGLIGWEPNAVVEFGRSFSFAAISRQRFVHGRIFGAERAAEGWLTAIRILVASPIVPFVIAARLAARVMSAGLYKVQYLLSLPLILVLAAFWAAGEAVGATGAALANRR